jgi:hypothetical protein
MGILHRPHDISRRGFTGLLAAGTGLTLFPMHAHGQRNLLSPKTLCVMCIDYRFDDDGMAFFNEMVRGRPVRFPNESFDLVAVAGASLAGYFPSPPLSPMKAPHSLQEQSSFAKYAHGSIEKVIVLDHRDCGAYKEVFGPVAPGVPEFNQHKMVAQAVQPWFTARSLTSEFYLMDNNTPPRTYKNLLRDNP